ncbi:MAG: HD-GYP domain-containing protein [Rhodocyclaceae bacterium]|nr:HD-GYP domain-containing protein [Rhodocyclaceae bacterium]
MNNISKSVSGISEGVPVSKTAIIDALIAATRLRDIEVGHHVERVGSYALHIARNLGWNEKKLEFLWKAAQAHDIGKIAIPDKIINKAGGLTQDEFELMKTHTTSGRDMLLGLSSPFLEMSRNIALNHHECIDGSGYPAGLSGERIPLEARIVAVADVFDALTTPRSYKRAWPIDKAAYYLIEHSARKFDRHCVAAFFQEWHLVLGIMSKWSGSAEVSGA